MITADDMRHRIEQMRKNWKQMSEARNLFDPKTSDLMRDAAFERRLQDIATLLQVCVNEIAGGRVEDPQAVCRAVMKVYDEYDRSPSRWEDFRP